MITIRKWACLGLLAVWLLVSLATGAMATESDTPSESVVPASEASNEASTPAQASGTSEPPAPLAEPPSGDDARDDVRMHLVEFYDFNGEVLGWVTVEDGTLLFELDGYPQWDGYAFQFWYALVDEEDPEAEQLYEPYVFGQPVTADLRLAPYYTPGDEVPTDGATQGPAPDAFDNIISDILLTDQERDAGEAATDGETATDGGVAVSPVESMMPESLVRNIDAVLGETDVPEGLFATVPQDRIVLVTCMFEGDSIDLGTEVTLNADLVNFPDGQVTYQWQNNASGTFEDVPDATGRSYTFASDGVNTRCSWQVLTYLWTEEGE